ncbi:MAG: DUF1559 domain-containing protein [Pirellulaceae bacterium]|jgi:hypothetical protein|nr:DUF1559 domain-containing protein [Pirellulaceae bacterium]MDP6721556.1 DUF1559 domain-containing protein [Pirellulaceae bacterium]
MPIPFACPYCQEQTLVEDEFAGQSGLCAKCGKSITVPYIPPDEQFAENEIVTGIVHRPGASAKTVILVSIGAVLAAGAAIGLVVAFLFPALGIARNLAHSHNCDQNLTRIGLALQAYESEQGTLPPAFIPGPDGKPMHSWRVLLLPYLDEHGLYGNYDFSQPWDSAHNQQLATRMPRVFACPADPDSLSLGESNYMVVVGPATMFPGSTARTTGSIGDDTASTISVVEVPIFGHSWLAPEDLTVEKMQFAINGGFGKEIGSYHEGGAHVLMADGDVRFLSDALPPDFIEGMTTVSGGELIPWDILRD